MFAPSDKEAWRQQALKDLKGQAYAEKLIWYTVDGLEIEPFFTVEEMAPLPIQAIGQAQKQRVTPSWLTRERIVYSTDKESNAAGKYALSKGAQALLIDLSTTNIQSVDIVKLLADIKLSDTPVSFQVKEGGESFLTNLRKLAPYQLKGSLNADPLSRWMQEGVWKANTWEQMGKAIELTGDSPLFYAFTVNSHPFHNAGASSVQEIAFTLSAAVTYLDELTKLGYKAEEVFANIELSVSVGVSYFPELAKLRALRYVFQKVKESYALTKGVSTSVHAQTSAFYLSLASPYTNLLRATTEAMAAVIGGCDALTILPYNALSATAATDEFAQRIARNVSVILKEEAYFDKVADPAAGAYYIEQLTAQLANQAWDLFLQVEEMGGLMEAFTKGFIQNEIEKVRLRRVEAMKAAKVVMIGVNKYQDGQRLQGVDSVPLAKESSQSVKLLPIYRLAEAFEQP